MMQQSFVVYGTMPGLNEIIKAARVRRGPTSYTAMKREWDAVVVTAIKCARLKPHAGAVDVEIRVIEPNRRRDPNNIYGGVLKFVLDGIVQSGILKDDSQRWIKGLTQGLGDPEKFNPHVLVTISDYEGV